MFLHYGLILFVLSLHYVIKIVMAESFTGKGDTRRKKSYFTNKDREDRNYGPRKFPIILTKAEGDKDVRTSRGKPQENAEKPIQPTIILRTREGDSRAVSPSQRAKKEDGAGPVYHLAPKPSTSSDGTKTHVLTLPKSMKTPVKLIDDQQNIFDPCLEYLTDQTDFVVIGVLGLQGVGKSTLMSHLAGSSPKELTNTIFRAQTVEDQKTWRHCTSGIDVFVTSNRVILLDCQPILSASVMDNLIQDLKKPLPPQAHGPVELMSTENTMEVQSLQMAAFLMSVCHVVMLVQDWFFNPNLIRFLHTAAMLKPPTNTASEDGVIEYFPQIMFVHTHCTTSDFTVERVKLMQDVYKQSFSKSLLQLNNGVGIGNGAVMQGLNPTTLEQEPLNLFLLPSLEEEEFKGHFKGHTGFEDLMVKMRQQLLGIGTFQLTTTQLSEKNWFHYSMKVWDGIKKSMFFQEYSRLLP